MGCMGCTLRVPIHDHSQAPDNEEGRGVRRMFALHGEKQIHQCVRSWCLWRGLPLEPSDSDVANQIGYCVLDEVWYGRLDVYVACPWLGQGLGLGVKGFRGHGFGFKVGSGLEWAP